MITEPSIVGLQPPKKMRVRSRDHLTSFQISKDQKVIIDQAFQMAGLEGVTKGEFIEQLCMDFIKRNAQVGEYEGDTQSDMWPQQ